MCGVTLSLLKSCFCDLIFLFSIGINSCADAICNSSFSNICESVSGLTIFFDLSNLSVFVLLSHCLYLLYYQMSPVTLCNFDWN